MHSLYMIQLVIGRVLDPGDQQPVNPHHVFRVRPQVPIALPNNSGPPNFKGLG
jgi:hypothetical protein